MTISHNDPHHSALAGIKGEPFLVDGPGEFETRGVFVTGVWSFADDKNGAERGRNVIYLFHFDDLTVCHLGSLGHTLKARDVEALGDGREVPDRLEGDLASAERGFEPGRIPTDERRRTNVPHIYAAGDVAGYWQLAHTGFREGEVAAENAMGHDAVIGDPAVPRPIYTDPEIAGVGLTEAQARETYGDDRVAVGRAPWVAIARAVMSGDTTGWVKTIHETTYGELLGVVIVGPHATDLIGEAVVALDAESTVETVADGMAPHPTLAEGLKEAALVALGRAIHLPPRRR